MPENIVGTEGYGDGAYEKPSPKDKGVVDVFQVLETFMERLALHQHQGNNSKEISLNFQKEFQVLIEGTDFTWNDEGNSLFKFTITMPAVANETNMRKYFYRYTGDDPNDWKEFDPTIVRLTATTFELYANDSTIDEIRVVYF